MSKCKQTKKALLSSVIALILCFSMLLGTTFAWFTDSVESGINKIQAGNLDVELYYSKDVVPEAIDANKVTATTDDLFTDENGEDVLWEPGVVTYTNLNVVNEGSLALKYQFAINFNNENYIVENNAKLSQVLKVAFIEGGVTGTREQILNEAKKSGVLLTDLVKSGYLDAGKNQVYGVVIYWEPSAIDNNWNVLNGRTTSDGNPLHIDLGVKLIATQKDAESDSFGNDYDKTASVSVAPGESIAQAISDVEDGGIVFLEPGVHNVASGPIVIENKSVSIIGMGNATINKNFGSTHIFTIKRGAEVTFENIHMDGLGNTREGVYVRWDCKVTLKNCSIKNTGGLDIMIDEASDAEHGEETASYVTLINTDIEDVAMCASPVTTVAATQNTYVYFNYDKASSVGAIDVQSINKNPENIIINGVASTEVGKTMQLYASNDAELAAVLNTIKTNENYWNKNVIVYLAAGEYSANHTINQYPQWNGTVGAGGSGNNYASGVPAGAPNTVITFVGETASTYSLRAASTPTVVFTGKITINGFGNAGTGFGSTSAITTFQNVAFDGANIAPVDGNVVAVMMVAAADNVYFENCAFQNTTHVTLGNRAENRVDNIYFSGCTFTDAGSLSGYPLSVEMTDCVVDGADGGFLNIQNKAVVNVSGLTANVGRFFIRTNGSGVNLTVEDSDITVYESEGTNHLVYFRGNGESAKFVDCTIAAGWTTAGVDTDSTLDVYNYLDVDGVTYVKDAISGDQTLYLIPSDYEGDTVNVAEGTTAIGGYAFAYNSNIDTIVLPSTVTKLEEYSFRGTSATKVVLNEGLTEIGAYAFSKASNLKEINFPSTVTTVGEQAFRLAGFETLTIPATITNIEAGAFRDLINVTTIIIEGDPVIANFAFRSCPNLTTVKLLGDNVTFTGTSQVFCRSDNAANMDLITIYVNNEVIAGRLAKAQGSARGYNLVCVNTPNENGIYTDTTTNKTYAYANDATTMSDVITNGAETVYLSAGNYTMPEPNLQGKTLMIKGTKDTVIDVTAVDARDQFVTGATLEFDGVTLNFGKVNYMGFANTASLTYKNCQINGLQFLFGQNVTFVNCDLDSNGAEHCVWTYGVQNVSFTDCDFTYGDRGINCYSDNDVPGGKQIVNIENCTFATTNTASEGAVEINSCFFSVGIEVNMEGCTAPAYGEMAYVSPWDSTNGAKTTINIQ